MKVSFFRNVLNYEVLCANSFCYSGIVAEYCSIATVYLDKKEFASFCSEFQKSYDYLIPFIDKAIIVQGIWQCVSITDGNTVVLVVMDHYQYPRYVAITTK